MGVQHVQSHGAPGWDQPVRGLTLLHLEILSTLWTGARHLHLHGTPQAVQPISLIHLLASKLCPLPVICCPLRFLF